MASFVPFESLSNRIAAPGHASGGVGSTATIVPAACVLLPEHRDFFALGAACTFTLSGRHIDAVLCIPTHFSSRSYGSASSRMIAVSDVPSDSTYSFAVRGETLRYDLRFPPFDTIMATYKELQARLADLTRRAEEARAAEIQAVIEDIKEKVAAYGLTEKDIFGRKRGGQPVKRESTVAPKYRDPKTGAEWSGRGREPAWIKGKNRERFLIK